ncbi:MAG: hypothetical protein WBN23_03980 [Woeseia sp.]
MPPADAMSMELIYQSMYEALSLSDSSLQIWMTYTFALVAAAHFAGNRLSGTTYTVVCSLYGLYAAVLIVRYFSAAYQILYYQDLLIDSGFAPWPVPKLVGVLIGSGTFLLMVGGTVLALWFVRRVRQEHLGSSAAGVA